MSGSTWWNYMAIFRTCALSPVQFSCSFPKKNSLWEILDSIEKKIYVVDLKFWHIILSFRLWSTKDCPKPLISKYPASWLLLWSIREQDPTGAFQPSYRISKAATHVVTPSRGQPLSRICDFYFFFKINLELWEWKRKSMWCNFDL